MSMLKTLLLLPIIFIVICPISHSIRNPSTPSPFGFINDLKGSHKGCSIKGLHKLKHYLKQFGYLKYGNQSNFNNDVFDTTLESALKTYQRSFSVKPTGTLDAATVAKMTVPRCGVPDIINGHNTMLKKYSNDSLSKSINIVAHYALYPNRPRWPSSRRRLTYGFLPNTRQDAILAVGYAFRTWDVATQFTFTFSNVRSSAESDISIGFFSGDHGDEYPFDNLEYLAHAFPPTDGRLHYNAAQNWVIGHDPDGVDLYTVGLHEIGHLVGLAHSQDSSSIMYPSISPGETKDLSQDDIDGIMDLYGLQMK
ncbi:metalloendoproteinase 2-MMP-like [Andrographis paniculata]|uniref:metalloendoproteinase 2-MMP-like n=1 Tax=Andrographis paniculata TaxID=175694 RepID=UPI0021E817E0|nr:metalloendoproteinase 2-MMP-like [Andrographis paniculata]